MIVICDILQVPPKNLKEEGEKVLYGGSILEGKVLVWGVTAVHVRAHDAHTVQRVQGVWNV